MATPVVLGRDKYRTRYRTGHGLVIGINRYQTSPPLRSCVADATAIAEILVRGFEFPEANVKVLLDEQATGAGILAAFLALANQGSEPDDRVVFFFAGHGHTVPSRKGDVGFLVPCDGNVDNLATLVRWDELTRGADLIPAKHILFLMDACYGGLAVKRSLKPGSMRFIKDMLLRPSRQVLAAGKGDEVVDDSGGPRPGHSPFTGHLLDALAGGAADAQSGVMTANGVMTYVYHAVGTDLRSEQTPHYGQLDGDGDLVFRGPGLLDSTDSENSRTDEDALMSIPSAQFPGEVPDDDILEQAKDYLSEDRHKLKLFGLIATETRRVMAATGEEQFPSHDKWDGEAFRDRVARHEAALSWLIPIQALLGYWATASMRNLLLLAPKRLADRLGSANGTVGYLALRWYPCLMLLYASGVAAVAANQWESLAHLFQTRVADRDRSTRSTYLQAVVGGITDLGDAFRLLPGHERHYVARSEYLLKRLQPALDDALFLGSDYESAFDRFEVLLALEYLHQEARDEGWAPPGRFAYKYTGRSGNPYGDVLDEAAAQGDAWPPLRAGLFGGRVEPLIESGKAYAQRLVRLGWR